MSISSTLPSVQPVHGEWAQRINAATRDLIYRLSLTPQALQRQQVFAIARESPPIAEPGLAFDRLVGPWVEIVAEGLYRECSALPSSGGRRI